MNENINAGKQQNNAHGKCYDKEKTKNSAFLNRREKQTILEFPWHKKLNECPLV